MKLSELKDELRSRKLTTSGTKDVLIARLQANDTKETDIADYSSMSVAKLRIELKRLGVPTSGSKNVLITRLQGFITMSEHEKLVRNRDSTYYEYINPYIEKLPNLYAIDLKSSPAKAQAATKAWYNDDKWKALLMDLETLDSASLRGTDGVFDICFVETVNSYDEKTMDPLFDITYYPIEQVTRFVETYPYLSFMMLQTEKIMAFYILQAGKYNWLSSAQLDWMAKSPSVMAQHAPSPEIANELNEKYNIFSGGSVGLILLIKHAPVWLIQLALEKNSQALDDDSVIVEILNTRDYDKIKLVLEHYRRITDPVVRLSHFIFSSITYPIYFSLLTQIIDDYHDLLDDYTLSSVLSVSSGKTTESARKLTEHILNLIEEKKLRVYGFVVYQAITNLDINTVARLLKMKHLNLDYYTGDVKRAYNDLMKHSNTNPDDVIAMIKLLDYYYNITQDKDLVKASVVSLPVLKFLASHISTYRLMTDHSSDLLQLAVRCSNTDVVKYIIKELGPFDQNAIKIASLSANGNSKISELLRELLK
jgi:hypothetical protein